MLLIKLMFMQFSGKPQENHFLQVQVAYVHIPNEVDAFGALSFPQPSSWLSSQRAGCPRGPCESGGTESSNRRIPVTYRISKQQLLVLTNVAISSETPTGALGGRLKIPSATLSRACHGHFSERERELSPFDITNI